MGSRSRAVGGEVAFVTDNHWIWLADRVTAKRTATEDTTDMLMCRKNLTLFLYDVRFFFFLCLFGHGGSGNLFLCKYSTEGKFIALN